MTGICPDCPNVYDCRLSCQRERSTPKTKLPIHDTKVTLVFLRSFEKGGEEFAEFNAVTAQGASIVQVKKGGRLTVRVSPNLSLKMGVKGEGLRSERSTEGG